MRRVIAAVLLGLGTIACGSDTATAPLTVADPRGTWTGSYSGQYSGPLTLYISGGETSGVTTANGGSTWQGSYNEHGIELSRPLYNDAGSSTGIPFAIDCVLSDPHNCDGHIYFTPVSRQVIESIHLTR